MISLSLDSNLIIDLYLQIKLDVLEARVEVIRKEQQEARLRSKAVTSLATPKEANNFSPASRNNTPSKGHNKRSSSSMDRYVLISFLFLH